MDKCVLCRSTKINPMKYGQYLNNQLFGVHKFCLYYSSNLVQNGKDDEGFLGFLEADIKREVKRISLLRCCYCREKYANVGCCEKRCRRCFHFICGLEHKAENQFYGTYRSFCHAHVKQHPERSPVYEKVHESDEYERSPVYEKVHESDEYERSPVYEKVHESDEYERSPVYEKVHESDEDDEYVCAKG